jgi:hypothetical protein
MERKRRRRYLIRAQGWSLRQPWVRKGEQSLTLKALTNLGADSATLSALWAKGGRSIPGLSQAPTLGWD